MYQFDVELEDGTSGEVNATTPDRWSVGDEVDYTESDGKFGKKLKLSKPMSGFNFHQGTDFYAGDLNQSATSNSVNRFEDREAKRQKLIMSQWAIRMAMEWEMNQAPPDKVDLKSAIGLAKQLYKYAEDLESAEVQTEETQEQPF